MKVIVLGCHGQDRTIDRRLRAVEGAHIVVALVRSKARFPDLPGTEIIESDALDEATLSRAFKGCDAVVCSLGTRLSPVNKVTLLSVATRALVKAMTRSRVRRLVCISGMGAGDSRGHDGFLYDRLILPLLLRNVLKDKDRQETWIRTISLNWVIVRPTVFNDEIARGSVKAVTDLACVQGGTIARADVARFVVDRLTTDTCFRRTTLIRGDRCTDRQPTRTPLKRRSAALLIERRHQRTD